MMRVQARLARTLAFMGIACAIAVAGAFKYALDAQRAGEVRTAIHALEGTVERCLALDLPTARIAPLLGGMVPGATITLIDASDHRVVSSSRPEWLGRAAQDIPEFPARSRRGDDLDRHGGLLHHRAPLGTGGSAPRYELWVAVAPHGLGAPLWTGAMLAAVTVLVGLLVAAGVTIRLIRHDVLQPLAALDRYAAAETAAGEDPPLGGDDFGALARTIKSLLRDRIYRQKREAESAKQLARALDYTRHIIDQAPDAVITCDAEGNVESFNPAAEALFGIDADFVITAHLCDILPTVSLASAAAGTEPARETAVRLRDGSTRELALSVSRARWADTVRYTIIARDVTTHKRIESALRDSERRLRQLVATAYEGIIALDADYKAMECNPRLAEILGTEPAALIGQGFLGFVAERYRPGLKSALAACFQGRALTAREVELESRRGDSIWTLVSATAAGGGLEPVRLYLMVTDISAQKAIQAELIDSRRRLELAMSTGNVGIWSYHVGTGAVEFDASSMRLLGWPVRAAVPEDVDTSARNLHPDDREAVLAALRDHAAGRSAEFVAEYRYHTPDRGYRWFRARGRCVAHGGEGRGAHVVGIHQDISEEKALTANLASARDEALAAAKAKAEFLANMSHELRTPLNGVLGMLSLVDAETLDAEQQAYIEVAMRSARELLQLIDNILDFSKIEARGMAFECIDFDLRLLAEEVTALLAESAHQKGLEIALLCGAGVPSWIRGDPGRLRQILVNLIGNAIKFTGQGEIAVEIDRGRILAQALRFEIRDTGIGIEPAQQPHVFDAFKQGDGSTTRRYGGSGLGLSITRELVTLMGGVIGLDSQPGVGSTFWFEVVLPAGDAPAPAGAKRPPLGGRRVLIHDPAATACMALRQALESWGAEVETLGSFADLMPVLSSAVSERRPFYAAVLDPGAEPEKLANIVAALRADPALAVTRVIATTHFGRTGDVARMRQAGAHACLTKPIRAAELAHAFNALLNGADAAPPIARHARARATVAADRSALIVDAERANRTAAATMLADLGLRVEVADSAVEALSAIDRTGYDFVFMDCQMDCHMPDAGGLAAAARIRDRYAPAPGPVVIAVSAHSASSGCAHCLATAGVDDLMMKPVTPETLAAVISKWSPVARRAAAAPGGGLDADRSAELLALLGASGYRELVARFAADAPATFARMQAAWESGRDEDLAVAVQGLGGSGSTIGAWRLGELCAALEAALRQDGGGDVAMLIARIGPVLEQTLAALGAGDPIATCGARR